MSYTPSVGSKLPTDGGINGFCMGLTMCAGFKPAVGSIVQVDDVEVEVELDFPPVREVDFVGGGRVRYSRM